MTERNYSGNFFLYNRDGIKVQMTVREDTRPNFMMALDELLFDASGHGFTVHEPVAGAGEKVERIAGYVVGTSKDKKAGEYKPCVHLYTGKGKFKVATVYHEDFDQLPFKVGTQKVFDGAAPEYEDALLRKVFNDCAFDIVLEPKLDRDSGQPILSDSGRIQYKFKGVKGAAQRGGMTTGKEGYSQSEPPPFDNEESDIVALQAQAAMMGSGKSDGYISPVIELRKQVRALGNELYASEWYTVSRRNVSRMTNGQYNDIDELTAEELTRMLAGLNQLKAKAKVGA